MKCLQKYPWVKLPRDRVPNNKGLMGAWMRLTARGVDVQDEQFEVGVQNAGFVINLK